MSCAFAVIGFGRAADGRRQTGIGPADLHQQIVRTPERNQPAFDGLLPVLDAGRGAKALRRDGADGRERILDAMMQLVEDELLQLVCGFPLLGVDAGLREQGLGVDDGLLQQQPKAADRNSCAVARSCLRAGIVSPDAPSSISVAVSGTIFNAPAPIISRSSSIICFTTSGLPKKRLSAG